MKKLITILLVMMFEFGLSAQAPEKMNYQAVVRDAANKLITNHTVGMRISIVQTTPTGTVVYKETQTATSNVNGVVSVEIGTGITTDVFSAIDWSKGPYYIKTEIDPAGGTAYSITALSELLSVPYALYAKDVQNKQWTESGKNIYYDKGFVGIGTESPGVPLEVASTGIPHIKLNNLASNTGYVQKITFWKGTTEKFAIGYDLWGTGDNLFTLFDTPNLLPVLNIKNGNVGIGNKNPEAKLEVSGQVKITGGVPGAGKVLTSDAAGLASWQIVSGGLTLPFVGTGALNDAPLFKVVNTTESGIGILGQSLIGVQGRSDVSNGTGVSGHCSTGFGINGEGNIGVSGVTYGTTGKGVRGLSIATSGENYGIYGSSGSPDGYGVFGTAPRYGLRGEATASPGIGVYGKGSTAFMGQTTDSQGDGIRVNCTHSTGITHAVYGSVTSPNGYSGYFIGGRFYVSGNVGIGSENYNPDYRLEVRAPGTTSTGIAGFYNSSGDPKVIIRQNSNGSGSLNIYNTAGTATVSFAGEEYASFINAGNLGIGTTTPNYKLDVRGTIGNNTTLYHSDKRWKNDILPLKYSIHDLMKLNGVSYMWNVTDFPDMGFDRNVQFGFIAQEFEEVIPELVSTDQEGYKSIDYVKLIPVLVMAIQEQQITIEDMKAENEELKDENNQLKMTSENYEARLREIENRLRDLTKK